nr:cobyrinate a,c-diamide synthase [Aciditerrimonas ferrireducens]
MAGTHSGVGKTTVATGLMAALAARGVQVASAKVGPDFIDPGYHALATGRPPRNLDAWIAGEEALAPLAARAGQGAEVLVVEGVMGLFDGAGPGPEASTAAVALALEAPVVLVVDASALSGSVAAVVHGFHTLHPRLRLGGVVLNRVGSAGHEALLREALAPLGIPVLGSLPRDDQLAWRDRHLGLVPVVEQPGEVRRSLGRLAALVDRHLDLPGLLALARRAPNRPVPSLPRARPQGRAVVGVLGGPAFSFTYQDNLERLAEAGAELVPLDPLRDPALPAEATGLVAGGGYPEVHVAALAENRRLLADVARRAPQLAIWAECGGLLWLCRALDGHRMVGLVPAEGRMTPRLTLGYREATLRRPTPLGPPGTVLRGHEFHYSTVEPPGDALLLSGRGGARPEGFGDPGLLATYLHLHLGADPGPAERFVAACCARGRAQR